MYVSVRNSILNVCTFPELCHSCTYLAWPIIYQVYVPVLIYVTYGCAHTQRNPSCMCLSFSMYPVCICICWTMSFVYVPFLNYDLFCSCRQQWINETASITKQHFITASTLMHTCVAGTTWSTLLRSRTPPRALFVKFLDLKKNFKYIPKVHYVYKDVKTPKIYIL